MHLSSSKDASFVYDDKDISRCDKTIIQQPISLFQGSDFNCLITSITIFLCFSSHPRDTGIKVRV